MVAIFYSLRGSRATVCLLIAGLLSAALPGYAADGQRFVRYGQPGQEKPGLLDANARIRDLSARINDISPETISSLAQLDQLDPDTLPLVNGEPRLGPPIARAGKIVAIGFNYRDHAEETGPLHGAMNEVERIARCTLFTGR